MAAVVLPAATHAEDVGHDTLVSEAIELPIACGVQLAPPSELVSSTAEPTRGSPNVVPVVPATTQLPSGTAGEVAGTVVVVELLVVDEALVPAPAPTPPAAGVPGGGLVAGVQATALTIPVPLGRAVVGTQVAPPSLVASTVPVAWSGCEDS